jgi:hypothetical protein
VSTVLASEYNHDVKYFEEAKKLWQTYVPKSGQANTVQGELIRAISKLQDEAQRNGNINWDLGHVILADFILDTLTSSEGISKDAKKEVEKDIKRIKEYKKPYTSDDLYDRITDRIVEWSREHKEPIPHPNNPKLHR